MIGGGVCEYKSGELLRNAAFESVQWKQIVGFLTN